MPRRPLCGSGRATGAALAALALVAAIAFGWGLPGDTTSTAARALFSLTARAVERVGDAPAAVTSPVVEATISGAPARTAPPHVRDLIGAAAVAAALLVAARRRRPAFVRTRIERVAVVALGGRGPPV